MLSRNDPAARLRRFRVLAAVLLVLLCTGIASAAPSWKPAAGPLMTRWAAEVNPARVLPEYPRPTMARKEWRNLNGLWDYAVTEKDAAPTGYEGAILVPFPIESALSGVMRRVTPAQRLWYRRTFTVPDEWKGSRVLLHFGAVDWDCIVSVNGREVARHTGGYDGFSADITPALRPDRPQEIVVAVTDASGGTQPRGKQTLNPRGIFYAPATGIWQTVWIEPVPMEHVAALRATPDVDAKVLRLNVRESSGAGDLTVEAVAREGGREVGAVRGKPGVDLVLPVPHPRLWSPDDPFLYTLRVRLLRGRRVVDSVDSYFGMRGLSVGKDERGTTRLLLNGKFVFQVGPLDQGYWPDGIYTAPTEEALRYDLEMTRRLGFNMIRKHVKVEPERWYYLCDKMGILVWQDMPSGDRGIKPTEPDIVRTPESARQYERELKALIDGRGGHPSIVMWVIFNEGWGQFDTARLASWTKGYDPSRWVNSASGWTDRGVGDVHDFHAYPAPRSPEPEPARAAVLGEFGGLGLAVPGHTWSKESWGYQGLPDSESLTRRYIALMRQAWALKDAPGLSACVYTQTTDVETECNGLLTYDRAVLKVDPKRVADANRGISTPEKPARVLVPTAQAAPVPWRWTENRPADNWYDPAFDAASWKEAPGGFGTEGTPNTLVRTVWKTSDIWLRREFTLTGAPKDVPELRLYHDEDADIYINGVPAAKVTGYVTEYEDVPMTPEARAALKPGRNVLAVHCRQKTGGQFIDVGIVERRPR